jgi:ribosomal protein S18 acetylase RimI-like enzyme
MIRPATIQDLDFLVHGNREMARETEALDLDGSILREGVRAVLEQRQPGAYRILEIDGRPAAQLLLTYEWSDWRNRMVWWIQSVWVQPEHRKHGCFRKLYEHVRAEAKAAGAGGLRLYVDGRNTRAQDVYRALGMDGGHYRVFEDMF